MLWETRGGINLQLNLHIGLSVTRQRTVSPVEVAKTERVDAYADACFKFAQRLADEVSVTVKTTVFHTGRQLWELKVLSACCTVDCETLNWDHAGLHGGCDAEVLESSKACVNRCLIVLVLLGCCHSNDFRHLFYGELGGLHLI